MAFRSLEGKENQTLRLAGDDLGSHGFSVVDCRDCVVYLHGALLALQLRNLERCTVIVVGQIKGATMMFGLVDCVVCLVSNQIRIHDSVRSTFRLHVRSNPIIEHCTELKFGPLCPKNIDQLSSDEVEVLETDINTLGGQNELWGVVHDFNWLKDDQSPNWCGFPPCSSDSTLICSVVKVKT